MKKKPPKPFLPGGKRTRLFVVGALAALVLLTAWYVLGVPAGLVSGSEVRIFIRKGAPFREAADSLAAHDVIASPRLFSIYARLRGDDRTLRWGTYVVRDAMGWERVLQSLRAGRGVIHTVTIQEGWMLADIAPALADALDLPPDSVLAAARDTALLHRVDAPTPTLEGYLFPDTYTFPDGFSAREAIGSMVDRFEQVWRPEWDSILPRIKLNRHDVITLASIVESEVRRPEERPVIAAVYLNRLHAKMELQADPTINYALGHRPGRVRIKDLRVNSPYNTYRYLGLPPGPICSPGEASIEAVLHPANVPWRFFVAAPDGHHEFRRTYAEHLEAIKMVRRQAAAADTLKTVRPPSDASADPKKP